ncbi:hypothetical protein [Natronobiforma cellulositropha]|nr:hypothetical protein [Natronobiforma cellulositropha]
MADSEEPAPSLPPCPLCGAPVVTVTVTGPETGYASPCGCRIFPDRT